MNARRKPELTTKERTRQKQLRWAGVLILVTGLATAGVVYHRATPDDEAERLFEAGTLTSGNARRYENEMKNIGGESNVMATELREWFDSLWHGRRLAATLAVLSLGGSLTCFLFAHLLNYPPPRQNDSLSA